MIPELGRRDRRIPEAHWPTCLTVPFRERERPCLKVQGGEQLRKTADDNPWLLNALIHMEICTHTYEHAHTLSKLKVDANTPCWNLYTKWWFWCQILVSKAYSLGHSVGRVVKIALYFPSAPHLEDRAGGPVGRHNFKTPAIVLLLTRQLNTSYISLSCN